MASRIPYVLSATVVVGLAGAYGLGGHAGLMSEATGQFTTDPNAPQATNVRAVHRDGQTFVTWTDVGPGPAADAGISALGALRDRSKTRYRVYRSERPIADVSSASLVGEALPLSAWNAEHHGRNPPDDATPRWYVIEDGGAELAPGSGLLVHHPGSTATAYYAVTAVSSGVENRRLTPANTSQPVAEAPGNAPPVLQRTERSRNFVYVENATLQHYVRWERGANSARPGQPFDYLVAIPAGIRYPAPVGIHLHSWGASMYTGFGWWFNAEKGAILLSSNQEPYDWWTGYHENFYDNLPARPANWAAGVVRPYSQRRLLSFLEWLSSRLEIDRTRVFSAGLSMGGSGSLMLAIRHPERFAWAASWVGIHVPRDSPQFKGSYELVWGKPEWNVRFEDGTPVWDYYDDTQYLRRFPERSIPFLTFANGKNDSAIGWPQAVAFLRALQETRQPHLFVWGQNGHLQRSAMPDNGGERVMPLDLRTDQSLPAFTRGSLDDDPGDGSPMSGDPAGQINASFAWETDSIVDERDRWEMTLRLASRVDQSSGAADVTPRRLQRFQLRPGDRVAWSNRIGGRVVQSGELQADQWGLVTLPQVQIGRAGSRVTVALTSSTPGR
jgi:hypothetical protein